MEGDNSGFNALVCDLDGTLLHSQQEAIAVPGRTRSSFLSENAALLLAKISRIFPVVIATGRNARSVDKLVSQLPDVRFSGFVLENGFVVREKIDDKITISSQWERVAALFPDWERLPFYENCAGFIFSSGKADSQINRVDIESRAQYAEKILIRSGYNYLVYKEKRKLFIYSGSVDKMRGLALLGVHPYIAMGDGSNDLEMFQQSDCPVGLISGAPELKEIVIQKNGFCSMQSSHSATCEMLEFAYEKIKAIG